MAAKHALLGLLLDRPAYPYQLADRLQQRLGPAWQINSGHLSQTIKQMAQDGLIERVDSGVERDDDSRKKKHRHVYVITPRGVDEFERWFGDTTMLIPLSREPLLVKITFAGPDRLKGMLEQIEANERNCASRLSELTRARDQSAIEGPRIRADQVLLRLSLDFDIIQLEGGLRWLRHAREMISSLLTREAIWPSTQERSIDQAREGLFGRMAARHLQATSDGQNRET